MTRSINANTVLASPNQSSTIFGLTGSNPIRFKNIFLMRFLCNSDTGDNTWVKDMTFIVKSTDRPSAQPVVEEINQYNRKRVIQTGIKYQPITCTIYDTADSAAMKLWLSYAKYYFGDYTQYPASQGGYGFHIRPNTMGSPDGINSQFFFNKIEIIQLWGNQFTSMEIMNPKINSFAPDELDYETNAAATITMSLTYEGIFHRNDGKPMPLAGEPFENAFGNGATGLFNGASLELDDGNVAATDFTASDQFSDFNAFKSSGTAIPSTTTVQGLLGQLKRDSIGDILSPPEVKKGGALSTFGNYDFSDFKATTKPLPSGGFT